jgi:RHS repeat-associated protein
MAVRFDSWNFYGLDMAGHMKSDTTKYYYLKDHLGSIRAVLNATNTVVSAQDYDVWGYLMENRTYQSENVRNKFTGKERDNELENNYDYFGARYYDARIGRWGGVEPLLEKYFPLSPYIYCNDGPLVYKDNAGKDVYLFGEDAKKVVRALRENTGLKYKFDKNTGKLTISGTAETKLEELLLEASKSDKVNVNLVTTRENSPAEWVVGAFLGSKEENNKIIATQYFNIKQAVVWEKAGGSEIGLSATHEIVEAFIGAILFPAESSTGQDRNYGWSHFLTVMAEQYEGNKQYYPSKAYSPHLNQYFLYNEAEKIYYPIK